MTLLALRALLRRVPGVAWLILGVCVVLAWAGASLYQNGRRAERAAVLVEQTVHDSIQVVIRDTVVLRDTVRLTRRLTHYDTVRATLDITDTVTIRAFILAADSTIKSCRETVRDLSLSCAARDSVIRDLRGLLGLHVAPVRTMTWKEKLRWALVGAAADEVAQRAWRR